MKNSLPRAILEHLIICGSRCMLESFFIPYGQGMNQALREIEKSAELCQHDFSRHSRRTVSVTLSRMKKQKLVSIKGPNKKAIWRITRKGKGHFKNLGNEFDIPPEDGKTRVIMFDIPEDRRQERNWLRRELLSYDYTPLQKSVFMGTRPLPIKLLKELGGRELISHVHIVGLENI